MLILLATVTAPTGCMHMRGVDDEIIANRQSQARDAEREAVRRCPSGDVEVRGASTGRANDRRGTSPIDYECKRPGS